MKHYQYLIVGGGLTGDAAARGIREVQRIGDDYKVGGPEDWKWPPNRMDHWGISGRDTAALSAAERRFRFRKLLV